MYTVLYGDKILSKKENKMSITYLQLTDKEFQDIIRDAFKQGAEVAKKHLEIANPTEDIIKEDEALKILGCSTSKLSKLRAERKIVFFTASRPYSYSRKSLLAYLESMRVCFMNTKMHV